MSGETVKIIEGVGIVGAKGMVSLFNVLSAFGGAIIGGILTFFGSVWIFNQQRNHDKNQMKVEKGVELMNLALKTHLLLREKSNGRSYKNPFSNMSNDDQLSYFISNIYYIKIAYNLITKKIVSFVNEIKVVNKYFFDEKKTIRETEKSEKELIDARNNIQKKLLHITKEIKGFVKKNG